MSLSYLWDDYVVYKNIKIYPFLMSDYEKFEKLSNILLFDKNQIPDPQIIKMSYLKFLLTVVPHNEKYKNISELLDKLFGYVFKDNNVYLTYENEKIIINFTEKISVKINRLKEHIKDFKSKDLLLDLFSNLDKSDLQNISFFYNKISNIVLDKLKLCKAKSQEYNDLCSFLDVVVSVIDSETIKLKEKDFDKLKNIILEYNAIQIGDENMHPDLKQEIQNNIDYLKKKQGYQDGDIEDLILSYKTIMNLDSYSPVKNMTIYQFRKEITRLNLIQDYKIYKTAEMSGMVTFKKPIPHWSSHVSDKPDYSGLLMDRKEFENKMKQMTENT